jgi:hypothetical protein
MDGGLERLLPLFSSCWAFAINFDYENFICIFVYFLHNKTLLLLNINVFSCTQSQVTFFVQISSWHQGWGTQKSIVNSLITKNEFLQC